MGNLPAITQRPTGKCYARNGCGISKRTNKLGEPVDIEIRQDELLEEVQNRFPNQLRICIQAIQIKKMSRLIENTPEDQKFDYEFEDAEVSS